MSQIKERLQEEPLLHPATTSMSHFDYPYPPGKHLQQLYQAVFKAVHDEDSLNKIAALMPRGHGKSEAGAIVVPVWFVLNWPKVKIAVISKTTGSAKEKVQRIGNYLEDYRELETNTKTTIETPENDAKEPTVSAHGMNSQITGGHYDVLIYDDIVDYENQRLESRRRKIRQQFRDYTQNLEEKDSCLPNGTVQICIGTRKHPDDVYQTEIFSNASWKTFVKRALDDWSIVEDGDFEIEAQDGNVYASPAEIPPGVDPVQNGVRPTREVDVLWKAHKPLNEILFDVVFGDDSNAVWRRENQNNPQALSGSVFTADMLNYIDELPRQQSNYTWRVGVDQAHIDSAQAAAEGDTDYWALAVVAEDGDQRFVCDLQRTRGIIGEDAAEWIRTSISQYPIDKVFIESNFAQSNMLRRLKDVLDVPVTGLNTTRDKMTRYQNELAPEFQSGRLRLVGQPSEWETWEQNEWIQHPDATHDDMTDAIELAIREQTGGFVPSDEVGISL